MLMLLHNMTLIKKTKNPHTCLTLSLSLDYIISFKHISGMKRVNDHLTRRNKLNHSHYLQMLKLLT